ncbi:MAG TPA: GspMb/PilO family protein [Pyrinomonadaceae bacterium]
MRDDTAVTGATSDARGGAALRARLGAMRASRRRGPFGLPELAALAVAALLLLAAVLSYLLLLVPARSRTQLLDAERQRLERMLQSQQANLGESKDTQQRVSEILTSLDRFEIDHLGLASSGSRTVYEEINRLIGKNGLRISGGIQFTQLQEAAPGAEGSPRARRAQSGEESGQRVVQSIFPGIGVTLTVEGTYANLRRFIRDIEADRQFVVINTVELEGVTDTNSGSAGVPGFAGVPGVADGVPAPAAAQPQAPSRGALVSLRLDMAAYFRRAAASAPAAQ